MLRRFIQFALIAGLTLSATAQEKEVKQEKPDQEAVFRTTSNLVVIDVFVRDHSGKEITGLKKEDFRISEDGKPQNISVFEFQQLASQPVPPPSPENQSAAPRILPTPAPASPPAPKPGIATAAPGKIQYQDRRLMVLFFDFSSMVPADQLRAQAAAIKFLDAQMTPSDMVAIMSFSSSLQVLQDFTSDRELLKNVIRRFSAGTSSDLSGLADTSDANDGQDTEAAFVADDTEFNIFNTDLKLSALETAAKMLAALPEKKALIYFSDGINKTVDGSGSTGTENQSQLLSTIDEAVRANVSFYPIDARGLVAMVPGGDATQSAPRGTGLYTGNEVSTEHATFNDSQETLVSLADDTGGKAFLDNNDLTRGITDVQQDIQSYYILGYYSTDPAMDGKYRRVDVKLPGHPEAKLEFRSGYFGPKQFRNLTASDKESQLQQALMLGEPITDLPLALEINYFRVGPGRYFVPVAVKIPAAQIALEKRGSNEETDFDFIGQVRDSKGKAVSSVRDGIQAKLNQASAASLQSRNFEYDTGFTLPPGDYTLKFLARENQTGLMGTFETKFTVPDLDAPSKYLKISSVVWSNQREKLAEAIGSGGSRTQILEDNPLVEGGEKIIPSITRVYRHNQNLYVYMEAYVPSFKASDPKPQLEASLSFYRGNSKVFETPPQEISEFLPKRGSTMPIQFQVPLSQLPAGRYTCQVNVVDPQAKKFAFARGPLVLLP